jgi:hypothetical protein
MASKDITISIDSTNQIAVDPYGADISIGKHDSVKWKCTAAGKDWVVCFGQESPFGDRHFFKGRRDSGPINPQATSEKYYKYTVEVEGYPALDPGIIVRP